MIAIVFPGQGSQKVGMGKDFFAEFSIARACFEEASDALGWDVAKLCFEEDERLGLTAYTQPAILTTEIAMLRTLQQDFGLVGDRWGGHSLGEYTALVGAGAIGLSDALRVVHQRGRLMQQAVPEGQGAMTAVTNPDLDLAVVEQVAQQVGIDIANHNAANQVVLSGPVAGIAMAEEQLAGRLTRLPVSAPFHSRMMAEIGAPFREVLQEATWIREPSSTVTSNYTGTWHTPQGLLDGLVQQLAGRVQWVDNMKLLRAADQIVEIGPGRPLRGFFRSIGVSVDSVFNVITAKRVMGS